MLRMAKVMEDVLAPNGFMTNGHMDHLNGNEFRFYIKALENRTSSSAETWSTLFLPLLRACAPFHWAMHFPDIRFPQ